MAQSMRFMSKARATARPSFVHGWRSVAASTILFQSAVCLLGMVTAGAARAEKLNDPTRPANLVASNQSGTGSDSEAEGALVLQSILIGPKRSNAIINGRSVALNGKIGDYVLVRLSETEAVLSRGKTSLTLKLFPNFEKKAIKKE